jgi:hypothetical protein
MLRLQFILFQADAAAQMLRAGALPQLRTAHLLLDNCAELLLERWIEDRLAYEELEQTLKARAIEAGIPEDHPHFAHLFSKTYLTPNEASRVARLFHEKLRYVAETRGALSPKTASVLLHVHRYRNESYHTGRVRPGIVRTTVALQIHLICDLVRVLKPGSAGYSSAEDHSWLMTRFGIRPSDLWDDRELDRVLSEIRREAEVGDVSLVLADNLDERISALDETIEFIIEETRVADSPAAAIAAAQAFTLQKLSKGVPYPLPPRGLEKPFDGAEIDRIRHVPAMIRNPAQGIDAFDAFADADASVDGAEYVLHQLANSIEMEIQSAIDRARGK